MRHLSNTPALLTREYVISQFSNIFDSSIILDSRLHIVAASSQACQFLQSNPSEIIGKSLCCLSDDAAFEGQMRDLLRDGFFYNHCFELKRKDCTSTKVKVSGFYLGLISDFSDLIVISVYDIHAEHKLAKQLQSFEASMEDLIYQAAHDLRGPIATILGLVNVSKVRKDDCEVDKLFEAIGAQGKKLDDSLRDFLCKMRNSFASAIL
jgi:nitrogen-specific signal transduction histidine kinase